MQINIFTIATAVTLGQGQGKAIQYIPDLYSLYPKYLRFWHERLKYLGRQTRLPKQTENIVTPDLG